jgi:GTP-binding protein LepA
VVDPLAFVCHKDSAQEQGRIVCKKLQEVLPRQQFVTVIQAKADSKIVASERIRAFRKDVLTTGGSKAVGGGDVSRKKKLLEKQKRGKKRSQGTGRVTLSQQAFNSVISR